MTQKSTDSAVEPVGKSAFVPPKRSGDADPPKPVVRGCIEFLRRTLPAVDGNRPRVSYCFTVTRVLRLRANWWDGSRLLKSDFLRVEYSGSSDKARFKLL